MNPNRTAGAILAIVSAASFGISGSLATPLLASGWSPTAAVTARLGVAALVLTVPAIAQLRGGWSRLRSATPGLLMYGILAVAGAQLCFFNAIRHLDVGVALLLEYLGTVLVVLWVWVRHGQRPRPLTLAGAAVALVGLVLVLGITGTVRMDMVGVLWGLGAAVGLAMYFLIASKADGALPPLVLAWAGMVVGTLGLVVAGLLGAGHLQGSTAAVRFPSATVPWFVPVLGLSLLAAAVPYVAGIIAARTLGARLASFVGLLEVVFAILFAWALLHQLPRAVQLTGGVAIIAGVVLVRMDEGRRPRTSARELSDMAAAAGATTAAG